MHPVSVVNNVGHFNHLVLRMPKDLDVDTKVVKSDSLLKVSCSVDKKRLYENLNTLAPKRVRLQ